MGQSERFLMVLQPSGQLGSEPRFGSLSTVLFPLHRPPASCLEHCQ